MNKVFKILTIDGGGIKGLYSSTILEHFENKFGGNISNYFDMVCGTSTGGLIALGIALKIPVSEISRLYIEKGNKIFPTQNFIKAYFRQYIYKGKYSDYELRKALEDTFGTKKFKECNNIVCIPSYSITDARPWIFKYGHREESDRTRDDETLCVDIALATSAAPTYLPMAEIKRYDNKQYIDGGIYANDPTLVAFIEAIKFFVGVDKEYKSLEILSISSLNSSIGEKPGRNRMRAIINWRSKLPDAIMNAQAEFIKYYMNEVNNINSIPIKYVRIPSEALSSSQEKLISLDNSTKQALDLIRGKGNDAGEIWKKKEDVARFFKNKKDYQV